MRTFYVTDDKIVDVNNWIETMKQLAKSLKIEVSFQAYTFPKGISQYTNLLYISIWDNGSENKISSLLSQDEDFQFRTERKVMGSNREVAEFFVQQLKVFFDEVYIAESQIIFIKDKKRFALKLQI